MPVWLRNITFKFIQDSINQENKTQEEAHSKATNKSGKTTLDWVNPDKSKF